MTSSPGIHDALLADLSPAGAGLVFFLVYLFAQCT